MMMFIYIKQHLSNIWSSIHEKVKGKTETKLKKSVAYKNKRVSVCQSPRIKELWYETKVKYSWWYSMPLIKVKLFQMFDSYSFDRYPSYSVFPCKFCVKFRLTILN